MAGAPPFSSWSKKVAGPLLQPDVVGAGDDRARRDLGLERSDRVQGDDVLEPEVGQGADVGAVVDRMGRQGEAVAMPVDQGMVPAGLVGHLAVGGGGLAHLPGGKERGIDDACAAYECDSHGGAGFSPALPPCQIRRQGPTLAHPNVPSQPSARRPGQHSPARRHHHGRERALGQAAGPSPHRGPPPRGGGGADRNLRGAGPGREDADPLCLLGRKLEPAAGGGGGAHVASSSST